MVDIPLTSSLTKVANPLQQFPLQWENQHPISTQDTSNAGVVETAARIMEILDRRKVPVLEMPVG